MTTHEHPPVQPVQHQHHGIDYIEFSSPEAGASAAFFAAAFGWGTTPYGPEYTGLHDGRASGAEAGGIASGEARAPLVILYSTDLDASLAAVTRAGGSITQEPFDFPGGRRFHFREPGGTELAVWSEGDQPA